MRGTGAVLAMGLACVLASGAAAEAQGAGQSGAPVDATAAPPADPGPAPADAARWRSQSEQLQAQNAMLGARVLGTPGGAGSQMLVSSPPPAPGAPRPGVAATVGAGQRGQGLQAAEASIDPEKIRAHVRFLADDLLEGRGPGLRGSELAAKYIATQFALYGLQPGGDNGTYLQQVRFVGINANPATTSLAFEPTKGGEIKLAYGDDYTVSNRRLTEVADIDAPLVFVGYGVVAPEFGWNDYAGVDVKGKVIVCIVGDPPSDDPKFFGGKALTYYGRWTYKFEEAARQGAVGALIIHRTDLASYGWDVVKNSNTSEKTYLADDKNPQLEAASWIQLDVAKKLFAAAGMDADAEITAAGKRGFKAVELPVKLKAHIESTVRPFESPNVIGILPRARTRGRSRR